MAVHHKALSELPSTSDGLVHLYPLHSQWRGNSHHYLSSSVFLNTPRIDQAFRGVHSIQPRRKDLDSRTTQGSELLWGDPNIPLPLSSFAPLGRIVSQSCYEGTKSSKEVELGLSHDNREANRSRVELHLVHPQQKQRWQLSYDNPHKGNVCV